MSGTLFHLLSNHFSRENVKQELKTAGLTSTTAAVTTASRVLFRLNRLLVQRIIDAGQQPREARYFFGASSPTSLDVAVASYVAVCAYADFGFGEWGSPLSLLVKTFYPALLAHSNRMYLSSVHPIVSFLFP